MKTVTIEIQWKARGHSKYDPSGRFTFNGKAVWETVPFTAALSSIREAYLFARGMEKWESFTISTTSDATK